MVVHLNVSNRIKDQGHIGRYVFSTDVHEIRMVQILIQYGKYSNFYIQPCTLE